MKNPIATCKLWCRSEDELIEFDINIGMPIETGKSAFRAWSCEWSLGDIWPYPENESESYTSLHALSSAISSVTGILILRENHGDKFYTDAGETDRIEDLEAFLPITRSRRPEKKLTEQGGADDR